MSVVVGKSVKDGGFSAAVKCVRSIADAFDLAFDHIGSYYSAVDPASSARRGPRTRAGWCHSDRSASNGSTRVADRAGR
jgi:hypothetical protein